MAWPCPPRQVQTPPHLAPLKPVSTPLHPILHTRGQPLPGAPTAPPGREGLILRQSNFAAWLQASPQGHWAAKTLSGQSSSRPTFVPRARETLRCGWTQKCKHVALSCVCLKKKKKSVKTEARSLWHPCPSRPSVRTVSWGRGPRLPPAERTSEALLLCAELGSGRRDASWAVRLVPTGSPTNAAFILKLN